MEPAVDPVVELILDMKYSESTIHVDPYDYYDYERFPNLAKERVQEVNDAKLALDAATASLDNLLAAGFDPNSFVSTDSPSDDKTFLTYAIDCAVIAAVRLLLKYGGNLDTTVTTNTGNITARELLYTKFTTSTVDSLLS
jgi:hypothetical protein